MRRQTDDTRSRILEAAAECFAQQGYDASGVAEVCRRAGVSKGGFYHHFPSKQAVFLELLDRWLVQLDTQLQAHRAGEATVPKQLQRMVDLMAQVFQAAGGQLPMFLEFWSKAAHEPAVWEATIAPYRRYRALFADMIEAGVAEGTLRPTDADTAACVIVSLAVGMLLQGLLDPDGADWGQVAEDGVHMLLEGLARRH